MKKYLKYCGLDGKYCMNGIKKDGVSEITRTEKL
jgi:hypothetical protein